MKPTRLFEFIEFQKDNLPLEKAFSTKNEGTWESLSTSDFIDKSIAISRALIGKGIKAGDKIAMISTNNRTEWCLMDVGILSLGAVTVPIYPTISSKDYKIAPSIDPNYLSEEKDKIVAAQSIKLARKIISQPAMKKYNPKEFAPGIQFQSEDELKKVAGDIGTTIFHPVGTCAMGSNKTSVTDSNLKVRGVDGLRIADASVMPTITSGNTNAPTLMIAEKASEMILQSH